MSRMLDDESRKALNPCRAGEADSASVCTTARGTPYCLGCLRSAYDVDHWLEYSDDKKREIIKAINDRVYLSNGNFPS